MLYVDRNQKIITYRNEDQLLGPHWTQLLPTENAVALLLGGHLKGLPFETQEVIQKAVISGRADYSYHSSFEHSSGQYQGWIIQFYPGL